jgi:hypothetical protein
MIIEKENDDSVQEIEYQSDNALSDLEAHSSTLTVNQLKSRLNAMNVQLDMHNHSKSYYVQLYTHAINDPAKRELIKDILIKDREEGHRKKEKKDKSFIKQKRNRENSQEEEKREKRNLEQGTSNQVD